MTILHIKTYDIFVTNTIDIIKASKYHFPWCNLSFSPSLTQYDSLTKNICQKQTIIKT
jgi:hypothetical protein